jgi:hypothetical protein
MGELQLFQYIWGLGGPVEGLTTATLEPFIRTATADTFSKNLPDFAHVFPGNNTSWWLSTFRSDRGPSVSNSSVNSVEVVEDSPTLRNSGPFRDQIICR